MRVLALTRHSREGSASRLRFVQYEPALREAGIELEVSPLLRAEYLQRFNRGERRQWGQIAADYLSRIAVLSRSRRYDLLWIEKELFPDLPAWGEALLKHAGIPYVADYDDAVFHNYDLGSGLRRALAKKIDHVMRDAALVMCGNAYLAGRAELAGAHRVAFVPTVIDLDRYSVKVRPVVASCMRIVWIGSPSTARYLQLLRDPLAELAKRHDFCLRVIGAQGVDLPGVTVECFEWSEDREVEMLRECDVGVMPLPDSPWERGKCGYKLIQYMACGLPVVGSGVGVNREIVRHGEQGFIADTPGEWIDALGQLLADGVLRATMGAAGRRRVEEDYCLQQVAPRLAELLLSAAGGLKEIRVKENGS